MTALSLLVAPAWVGDAVMSEPLLRQIAAQDQQPVDILAPPWVAPLYERMPGVGAVIPAPFAHGRFDLKTRWQIGRQLKARHYRHAYVLPNSFKSALPVAFAGIPERVGFTGECRYGLLNRRQTLNKQAMPRMVDRFLALAPNAAATPLTPDADCDIPRLQVDATAFAALCQKLNLQRTAQQPLAILCPGAEYGPAKRWPTAHFAKLSRGLAAEGYAVWIIGSSKDAVIGADIVQQSDDSAINLCGRTQLAEAIDLLSGADVVVSNDSGLMHVAAALNRPLVALFGSSSPEFTPPLSRCVTILQHPVPCSPCFARECRYGHLDCLTQLTPAQVQHAVTSLVRTPLR